MNAQQCMNSHEHAPDAAQKLGISRRCDATSPRGGTDAHDTSATDPRAKSATRMHATPAPRSRSICCITWPTCGSVRSTCLNDAVRFETPYKAYTLLAQRQDAEEERRTGRKRGALRQARNGIGFTKRAVNGSQATASSATPATEHATNGWNGGVPGRARATSITALKKHMRATAHRGMSVIHDKCTWHRAMGTCQIQGWPHGVALPRKHLSYLVETYRPTAHRSRQILHQMVRRRLAKGYLFLQCATPYVLHEDPSAAKSSCPLCVG